jgi:hypothetical protein
MNRGEEWRRSSKTDPDGLPARPEEIAETICYSKRGVCMTRANALRHLDAEIHSNPRR